MGLDTRVEPEETSLGIPHVPQRQGRVSKLTRQEIEELYARYAPVVHRRAFAVVGRDADAWDVVQEVFEKMLKNAAEFRAQARPMTWVYRITTNVALNLLRSRGVREPEGGASGEPALEMSGTVEARQMLARLSEALSPRELSVVAMTVIDGMTQEEIADTLGLSRKTINRELEAIRQKVIALGFEKFEVPA
ncbi:MAG: sigma-70 family RNA polymerase sigma factor [Archangiaceae bacterium]|nr:sigma-70 family RNA polymerase sigma factor [Archangiaceae bacterium]